MEKYKIRAIVEIEVLAEDAAGACEGLDIEVSPGRGAEVNDVNWHVTDSEVVPYERPDGTDRWAHGAKSIRFCEGRWGMGTNVALAFEDAPGHWWWSNGHVMLRCDGAAPDGPRRIDDRTYAETARVAVARKAIEWSRGLHVAESAYVLVHEVGGDVVCLADQYFRLVNSAGPVTWMVGEPTDPIHAVKDGEVIAVVMPVRYQRDDIVIVESAA